MTRQSHSFSIEYAELYGVECAILINHFQFWIERNQKMGRNFHDGRTWIYQTQKEIASIYSYWSEDIVFKNIKKLIDLKILIKGNYNKTPFDKTAWYSFENEKMFTKPSNDGIDSVKRRNQIPSNDGIRNRQTTEPIPDTKTDIKKEQQQAAAVFSNSSNEEQQASKPLIDPHVKESPPCNKPNPEPKLNPEPKPIPQTKSKIYGILKDIDIPEHDKIEISIRYPENVVINAIGWATDENNPPSKCLAASIKFACSKGLSKKNLEVSKITPYEELKKHFKNGEKYNQAECFINTEGISFQRGMKYDTVKLDKFFSWNKIKELCEAFGIKFVRKNE